LNNTAIPQGFAAAGLAGRKLRLQRRADSTVNILRVCVLIKSRGRTRLWFEALCGTLLRNTGFQPVWRATLRRTGSCIGRLIRRCARGCKQVCHHGWRQIGPLDGMMLPLKSFSSNLSAGWRPANLDCKNAAPAPTAPLQANRHSAATTAVFGLMGPVAVDVGWSQPRVTVKGSGFFLLARPRISPDLGGKCPTDSTRRRGVRAGIYFRLSQGEIRKGDSRGEGKEKM